MIIYSEITSGDEVFSDSFPPKEVAGAVYEVECKMVDMNAKDTNTYGIENNDENASSEPQDSDVGTVTETGPEICRIFELKKAYEDPKDKMPVDVFQDITINYLKKVFDAQKARGMDEAALGELKKASSKYLKKIVKNYDNFDLWLTRSQDPEGLHVLVDFREDGLTPYCVVWKAALVETKL